MITGLEPGEVVVHRNITNLIHPADLNMLSVVEFAVHQLGVRHIILCGHCACGGIHAAFGRKRSGLVDNWLQPIRDVAEAKFACDKIENWSATDVDALWEASVISHVCQSARNVDPLSASNISPPQQTISAWPARRWPVLQRVGQARVMGIFGFSFESGS